MQRQKNPLKASLLLSHTISMKDILSTTHTHQSMRKSSLNVQMDSQDNIDVNRELFMGVRYRDISGEENGEVEGMGGGSETKVGDIGKVEFVKREIRLK